MEVRPKISRRLLIVVIFLFGFMAIFFYGLLSSEKLTKYAINVAVSNFLSSDKLNIETNGVEGCFLSGIKIKKIEIRHVKPNFEAKVINFSFNTSYGSLLSKGAISVFCDIGELEFIGLNRLPDNISSIPAFMSPLCLASLPGNIRLQKFHVNRVRISPLSDKTMNILFDGLKIGPEEINGNLKVNSSLNIDWKSKPLAIANFDGVFEQRKNKINGNLELNIAKQIVVSEITVGNSKRGIEFMGNVASQTVFDLMPLSQWLGYMWQIDYPYSFSGRIHCQGSWLYNKENGFIANLSGKYEKVETELLGIFFSLLEMNGDWKLFNGDLSLRDGGSRLLGHPISINGKIESIAGKNRKYDISIDYNSIAVDKLVNSIPWMIRRANKVPDLAGVATLTVKLHGFRPMVNSKIEIDKLHQKGLNPLTKLSGKAFYLLSESGKGNVNGNFLAETNGSLPLFFRRFSEDFYAYANEIESPASFSFSLTGSFDERIKLKGKLLHGFGKDVLDITGNLASEKLNLNLHTKENRVHSLKSVDPIDFILMR